MTKQWFIPYNVPSSKNSKQWTGKILISSKATQDYKRATAKYYSLYGKEFREITENLPKPLKVSFTFIRGSKHKFDYINPLQTVQDIMVKYNWIEDDNADIIIPEFKPYIYDKKKSGVIIEINI